MKYAFIFLQILLLSTLSLGQDLTRSQQLNRSVAELYQNGKYDEAIPLAEEIVGLERKNGSKVKNLVNALENLALIELSRFKRSQAELASGTLEHSAVRGTVEKWRRDAEHCENSLREAIRLADAGGQDFREQRVSMLRSLAWLLYRYQPADPQVSITFDKIGRDKFEMRARARFYERVNEVEKVYKEALSIAAEANDNSVLIVNYDLAVFEVAMGDLENAIPRLEKCIADVERAFGPKSPSLLQPLELYVKALAAAGQDDLAFEMVGRIVQVTGKSASLPKTLLNISLRADKAFAPINASGIEANAKANKERLALAGRRATFNAGFDAMLAVSTHGREFYDSFGPAILSSVMVRVLVDETGRVVEAEGLTDDAENKKDAEEAVREWRFKPFTYAGRPGKMKGYVECILLADRSVK
jgi:tetratricopeptide (TPR) repeat protein